MRDWLAGLSFWPLFTYLWSGFVMFYVLAASFGFAEVVGALGGLADRLGLGS